MTSESPPLLSIPYAGHPWYFCARRGLEYNQMYKTRECIITTALGNSSKVVISTPPKKARLYQDPKFKLTRSKELLWLSRNKYR